LIHLINIFNFYEKAINFFVFCIIFALKGNIFKEYIVIDNSYVWS